MAKESEMVGFYFLVVYLSDLLDDFGNLIFFFKHFFGIIQDSIGFGFLIFSFVFL